MLNIGAINFGVDADTKGLQKAIGALQQFQKVVDRTANAQEKGSAKAAAALGRQESAIKRAFQQTINLRRELLRMGARSEDIARVSNAFRRFTTEMTSGKLSAVQFGRAVDAFNAKLGRSKRALQDLRTEHAGKFMSRFSEIMRDLESSAVLAVGPLSGIGARIRSIGAIAARSGGQMVFLLGTITALSVGLGVLSTAAVRAERVFEQMEARFLATSGSAEQANSEMAFVIRTSRQLGLRIKDTSNAFSRLTAATAGSRLEGQATRDIFLGVANAAAAMRLENVEVEGVFRAVEQMISKGVVSSEELRQQLGERLPGAFRIAAAAMGLVDDAAGSATQKMNKLLASGQLTTDEFAPKFAEALTASFGKPAQENIDSFAGRLANLDNAQLLFARNFDQVFRISQLVKFGIEGLTNTINFLGRTLVTTTKVMGALVAAFIGFNIVAVARGFLILGRLIAAAAMAMKSLAIASGAVNFAALARMAAAVAAGAAAFYALDRILGDVDLEFKELGEALNSLNSTPVVNLTDAFDRVWNKIRDAKDELSILGQLMDDPATRFRSDLFLFEGLVDARKELRDLSEGELATLNQRMAELGIVGTAAEDRLQTLFSALARVQDEVSKFRRQLEFTPEGLREMSTEFARLNAEIVATERGSRGLEIFQFQAHQLQQMERMRDLLERMNLSTQERNALLGQYEQMLDRLAYAQDNFSQASTSYANAITDALDAAIFSGNRLSEVLHDLFRSILQITLRESVLNPLGKILADTFSGTAAPTAGAKGLAFSGGKIQKFAQGGILDRPTMFATRSGPALGGEAGTEAILPLKRKGGRLGVEAYGSSGSVAITNYNDFRGADPSMLPALLEHQERLAQVTRNQVQDEIRRGRMGRGR